ncbi:uncharacterized protein LOC126298573 isoform X3 [Schistocerca gregaria]|uniref:uncharacterized protein LOC126298573 isoform X3 n=1 Tax=Schistocerca gregaria TaxID=7010 RepID=UPI00211ECBB8|nr:uncharacterized protein LOC126298573 isoform X3 [Schistocerca gregaria]
MNATLATAAQGGCGRRQLGPGRQLAITLTYVLGVAGNVAALLILRGQARHRRHALMLRCLAANDLVALTGMLLQLYLKLYLPCEYFSEYWSCVVRVLWRLFGLGSGCVAIVMAVERWLALTHPFFYQMHVTYHMIKQSIFILWAVVLVLVCLPLTGFGIYFEDGKCVRLRKAKAPEDVAYAYLYFTFDVDPDDAAGGGVAVQAVLRRGGVPAGAALHAGPVRVRAAAPPAARHLRARAAEARLPALLDQYGDGQRVARAHRPRARLQRRPAQPRLRRHAAPAAAPTAAAPAARAAAHGCLSLSKQRAGNTSLAHHLR